jgi:phosphomevalonate kinase
MKTSESIKQIAEALVAAQKEIRFAVKDSTNPHYKSKYANINSVIDAVKAPLNNNGIAILQSLSPSDDNKLHLTTRLLHSSGEWIEDTAVCPIQKQDPQGLGSAISYIRRYSISSLCALYADDDDGQSAALNAADYLQKIAHSQTLEELQANYNFVMGEVKNDRTLSKMVIEAKDKRKAEL